MKIKLNIKRAYHSFTRLISIIIDKFSKKISTKVLHFLNTGKWIDLNNPKDFNEKLQWLKLNEKSELKSVCSDKYEVRNYIYRNHDPKILNTIIGVYDKPEDIVWEELPDKFAIKCTHGCGYNIIAENKDSLDKEEVLERLSMWLRERYSRRSLEYHYDFIRPRILIEDYIEPSNGLLPIDYKIYCFGGVPKLVLVCSEREDGLKLDFFDLDWVRLAIGHKRNESNKIIPKPQCFDDMVMHAEMLSKPFKFVRVDFYEKDSSVVFGEMTFTPAANMANYYSDFGLDYLGDLLDIK